MTAVHHERPVKGESSGMLKIMLLLSGERSGGRAPVQPHIDPEGEEGRIL